MNLSGDFMAGDFMSYVAQIGDFMSGDFMSGDFLTGYRFEYIDNAFFVYNGSEGLGEI